MNIYIPTHQQGDNETKSLHFKLSLKGFKSEFFFSYVSFPNQRYSTIYT